MKTVKAIIVIFALLYIIEHLFGTAYAIEGLLYNRGFQLIFVLIGLVSLGLFILWLVLKFLEKSLKPKSYEFVFVLLAVTLFAVILFYNVWSFLKQF